nr:MAG TPA: hypothetical protein [Caudoviricetes sp.]
MKVSFAFPSVFLWEVKVCYTLMFRELSFNQS